VYQEEGDGSDSQPYSVLMNGNKNHAPPPFSWRLTNVNYSSPSAFYAAVVPMKPLRALPNPQVWAIGSMDISLKEAIPGVVESSANDMGRETNSLFSDS
jgi:hypothetical protein